MNPPLPPRTPWRVGFPDVFVHSSVRIRDAHPAYALAKAGDADAAFELACDLLSADTTARLAALTGAEVLAITTLTESRDARKISLRPATRDMLWEKHGEVLDHLWRAQFGHGIDCLTDIEAQNLCRQPSLAAIEDFLAKAAIEARGRGLDPAIA
ncbi:hypothetical protein [Sphingomonas pituitosa]|uniref:hypothetical protein n=1 Tax=Sphingomonas pituitosa TaxID=99597 RepID=UPI0012EDC517|nr:hypothetical protein [Sphingomonas pituitosa]